ncbi:MAG TPA: DUF6798 domain-containing protein [Gemmataceae bacterium]|jgi:hypothetical protein
MHENTSPGRTISHQPAALARASFALASAAGWSLLFGLAYTQPRLYYSNQNQYFLHGLAKGGLGFLKDDWLANTADPTPVFSTLVALTYRHLNEPCFYLYYILILGIYLRALLDIFEHLSGGRATPRTRLGFIALLFLLHSALLRWSSAQLFGVDYPWYLQAGVANQYILGAGLQPSVFGVFLVLSVADFLHDRPFFAVTWAVLAAGMHSTYLLCAASLTLAYLYLLLRDRRIREAIFISGWALLSVLPTLIYIVRTFGPTSPEVFAQAQHLLAHFRIPHHAQVDRWLDSIAWAQIGWILAAMYLVRGSRLFVVLSMCFVVGLVLTLVQIGTGNDTLALLFPWRVASILVPIATAIVLARIVQRVAAWSSPGSLWQKRVMPTACVALIALAVAGGAYITYFDLGYRTTTDELELLDDIPDMTTTGTVFLLPVEVPKLTTSRGAASLNFTPPPQRTTQDQNISVDFQQFRLLTGAPIYVDFKSVPYKDVEVLQWHERVLWSHRLYEQRDWNDEQIIRELRRRGITSVVTTADRDIRCDALSPGFYSYKHYRLYHVKPEIVDAKRQAR